MDLKNSFYPESRFGGFTDIDGTVTFYTRVNSLIRPSSIVVDYGCGRGAYDADPVTVRRGLRILKGKATRVIGLDVDAAAASNPFIDEFHLLDSAQWPVEDNSVDVCISDSVLEHLEKPEEFFKESRRVLRDSSILCIRTPNVISYVGLFSKLIPNKFRQPVLGKVQDQRKQEDVFPTLYRCNTVRKVRLMLQSYGFECVVYGYEAEPAYLSFSRIAYWLGRLHQRIAPDFLKPTIFAFARKHESLTG